MYIRNRNYFKLKFDQTDSGNHKISVINSLKTISMLWFSLMRIFLTGFAAPTLGTVVYTTHGINFNMKSLSWNTFKSSPATNWITPKKGRKHVTGQKWQSIRNCDFETIETPQRRKKKFSKIENDFQPLKIICCYDKELR